MTDTIKEILVLVTPYIAAVVTVVGVVIKAVKKVKKIKDEVSAISDDNEEAWRTERLHSRQEMISLKNQNKSMSDRILELEEDVKILKKNERKGK